MFDFLMQVSADLATAGAYYAARLISHRIDDGKPTERLWDAPPHARRLAVQAIKEIELAEGSKLRDVDDQKADLYIRALTDVAQTRAKSAVHIDEAQGKRILHELRQSALTQ